MGPHAKIHYQAFHKCETWGLKLSWDCLTSYEARARLHGVMQENPEFAHQILATKLPSSDEKQAEDDIPEDDKGGDVYDDDSSVKMDDAIKFLLNSQFDDTPLTKNVDGNLESTADTETLMENVDYFAVIADGGHGK